ncbi:MAG: ABC transporter permease [Thermoplasmata archaeon]
MTVVKEANAAIAICARELLILRRDWKTYLGFSFLFPVVFLGIFGVAIAQNLATGLPYNFLQFALVGMVACMLVQYTMMSVTSLVEERETGFTQEIFVAPVSRFSIGVGKVMGGSVVGFLEIAPFFLVAYLIGVPLTLGLLLGILWVAPLALLLGGALGILLSGVFANSPKAVDQAVIVVMFPQLFLSGALIPVSKSSGFLNVMVHAMPATYLVDLMRSLAYRGTSVYGSMALYSPLVDLLVVLGISAACFVSGTLLFVSRERNR